MEDGETLKQCAIRETAEETKRIAEIVSEFEPYVERYTTPRGEECACYMFIAIDRGVSDNDCEDTHDTYWIPFENVEEKLTYPNLKNTWNAVKDNIAKIMND